MCYLRLTITLLTLSASVHAIPSVFRALQREAKNIGIFNVVKFPNSVCEANGNDIFGTCYTEAECSERGGTSSGSCADGFGVCCVISITCGQTSNENCTYLMLNNQRNADMANNCNYKICPVHDTVSRIRLDLQTFVIGAPEVPNDQSGAAADPVGTGAGVGDCTGDSFSVSTGVGISSPVICGTNSGQHLFVDTDGKACATVSLTFGGANSQRNLNIHVTQFDRADEMGGPSGCLQYYTELTGTIRTFNWQTDAASSTHLSNQNYDVCIRRGLDRCVICYSAEISLAAGIAGSFGLSVGTDAALADAMVDSFCSTDYLSIPNGQMVAGAGAAAKGGVVNNNAVVMVGNDKFCGRIFGIQAAAASQSICTQSAPFKLSVFTDGNEDLADVAGEQGNNQANVNEISTAAANEPLGTQGFSIGFAQISCS